MRQNEAGALAYETCDDAEAFAGEVLVASGDTPLAENPLFRHLSGSFTFPELDSCNLSIWGGYEVRLTASITMPVPLEDGFFAPVTVTVSSCWPGLSFCALNRSCWTSFPHLL